MLIKLAERLPVPDFVLRFGAKTISFLRYLEVRNSWNYENCIEFWEKLKTWPLDSFEKEANYQHYEVDPWFFKYVLGQRLKYSCCYFEHPYQSLSAAEERMLDRYINFANLKEDFEGEILDLGCGWGSLTSRLLEKFPKARVISVTNSSKQQNYVQEAIPGSRVVRTSFANLPASEIGGYQFDIIFCVEMLEHIRNWPLAFERLSGMLKKWGIFVIHFFASNLQPFLYEDEGSSDWMAREFFSGGLMPSPLFLFLQDYFIVEKLEFVPGIHYKRTADKWVENLQGNKIKILTRLQEGGMNLSESKQFINRWRMFFIGCSEFFGLLRGRPFGVYIARLVKK